MKSLIHNGIYIPKYNLIGLKIKYKKQTIELNETTEQMAIQFVKKFDTDYIKDKVFVNNFLEDFAKELGIKEKVKLEDFDFSEIQKYLEEVKEKTEAMSKEEKKLARELKKQIREKLKEKYGYALVDGKKVPIMNWTVEIPSIFLSKGKNPLRGHWKRAIKREDITLNLSKVPKDLEKGWKEIVWEPNSLWIAKWKNPLDGKMKYVWFSPSSELRQSRAKKKWDKAIELDKKINKIEKLIEKAIRSSDIERKKLGCVVYLMYKLGVRVGDEKIAGERGTLGCTTLKKENVKLENGTLKLDFIGKDYVRWIRELKLPREIYKVFKELYNNTKRNEFIFKGIDSNKVSKFLREAVPGISAKTFRTWLAGKTFKKGTKECKIPRDSEKLKKLSFQEVNLKVAKKLNHKRKIPSSYERGLLRKQERLEKRKKKLKELEIKLASEKNPKKRKKLKERIKKQEVKVTEAYYEVKLHEELKDWNLNTSKNSYIDPRLVKEFCEKENIDITKIYSKSLREKFSWALKEDNT